MGVELKLHIGAQWHDHDDESMHEYHAKYGRGFHEFASIDLSGVDRTVWDLVHKYQKLADEEFEKTGVFNIIYTRVQREDEQGVTHEVNLTEDAYGTRIACIPLEEVRAALIVAQGETTKEGSRGYPGRGYRRYAVGITLIDSILANFSPQFDGRLVAYTYAH